MNATLFKFSLATALVAAFASTTLGAGLGKWIEVEGLVNEEPSFMVSVDVDRPDRVYREGDLMTVAVRAEKECYIYLFYYSGDNAIMLFPNQHQKNNHIPAQTTVALPGEGAPFRFRTTGPFGKEVLHAVASETPLDTVGEAFKDIKGDTSFKSMGVKNLRGMVVEVAKQAENNWAEARIDITTIPREAQPPASGKRVGVCIGISEYAHERVQDLQVSHIDAIKMAEAMKEECQVGEVILLTNEEATRENIERAIFHDLVEMTNPGDSVFIFYSGHGGRTGDQNGDEEDGFDEYLVPHDGILGKPETMILDDTFGRWMQELSGREIVIVMDNCYSGGASKSLEGSPKPVSPKALFIEEDDQVGNPKAIGNEHPKYDGMEIEQRRSKDLGQQNTVVMAACQADQLAWEMPASQKGSVLTHYLIESFKDAASDTNKDGNLSVQESYAYVKQKVENYVKEKFDTDQNPIIVDNAHDGILFRHKQ